MRTLLIFLLTLPLVDCYGVDCIDPATSNAYLFIPPLDEGDNSGQEALGRLNAGALLSDQEQMSLIRYKYGGRGVVASNHQVEDPPVQILSASELDDHMLATGILATSGGPHDEILAKKSSKDRVPQDLRSGWNYPPQDAGYSEVPNGCGIFATAVCDRILKRKTGEIDQKDWDETYRELGSFNGVTPFSYIAQYYQKRGFCNETKPLRGDLNSERKCPDYTEIKEKLAKGCDVKLFITRKSIAWFLPFSYPHIETVIPNAGYISDGPNCFLTTNSWGVPATIKGGTCAPFFHTRNTDFTPTGQPAWPADDARVWVQTTCKCDILQPHLNYVDDIADTIKPNSRLF